MASLLLLMNGTILECGDVFYQELEPEDGSSNFAAQWQPSLSKWQFKSDDTGNVFRESTACRLAHIHKDGTTITRVDYIGNRILDDEIFAEKKDLPKFDELLTGTKTNIALLANSANLETTINKINEIIQAMKSRGLIV